MKLKEAKPIELQSKQHLLQLVHVLLAHEVEAAEEYNNVIEAIGNGFDDVKNVLEEIRKDERNHMGHLLRCIENLDAQEATEIAEME